jgi:TonB family protein
MLNPGCSIEPSRIKYPESSGRGNFALILPKLLSSAVSISVKGRKMNAALIYRPNNRKLIWIAFACAVTVHLAAVGLAKSKLQNWSMTVCPGPEVEITDFTPANTEEPEIVLPPEQPSNEPQEFTDENVTPRPIRPRKKTPVATLIRSTGIGTGRTMSSGLVKALTLYAPRPAYPYEARRDGITGSGIAHLTVNPGAGNVIDAGMAQSTGSAILDKATVEALGRWRFKPGIASNIDVPITYTLTGVSY